MDVRPQSVPGHRPKVTFFTDAPYFGGAEMALGTLVGGLGSRFDVELAALNPQVLEGLEQRRPGSRCHLLPAIKGKLDIRGFTATYRRIRAIKTQIFHANLSGPAACQHALAACALLPGVKTVAVENLPYAIESPIARRLKRFNNGRLDAHVAVGRQGARDVESLFGLAAGSVLTIYNGVPDDLPSSSRAPGNGSVVGSIGRLDHQKGFDILLRAAAEVPEARVVLVGDGSQRTALEALAGDLGIADRVSFEGHREDAWDLLAGFDVFALPSRFEGLPLALIDAMLAESAIVTTPVGSIAEAITDGVSGLLVPPDDAARLATAIRRLLANPDERASMGEMARRRALEFSPAAMARDYERLYDALLAGCV